MSLAVVVAGLSAIAVWLTAMYWRRIDEAAANGELQGLAGEGKPLDPVRIIEDGQILLIAQHRNGPRP